MRAVAIATAMILLASVVNAEVHPNLERGLTAAKSYQLSDLDNVNLFNGSLTLTLSFWGSYPVSERLSYGLTLSYQSNLWETKAILDTDDQVHYRKIPTPLSNAGPGWLLTLGRLISGWESGINEQGGWLYLAPDGSRHAFYETLHSGEPITANVFYSRDNTYLRLSAIAAATPDCGAPDGDCQHRLLESPDGTTREFQPYIADGELHYRLIRVADRFGNHYDVTYPPDRWLITDQHGRVTTVYFAAITDTGVVQDPGNYRNVVDRIELPAFGGTTATYAFHYTVMWTNRGYCSSDVPPVSDGLWIKLPFLTSIDLPDASSFAFTYNADPQQSATWGLCYSAEVRAVTLPTRGEIRYDYGEWELPVCSSAPITTQSGVVTRELHHPTDPSQNARWAYASSLTAEDGASWNCPGERNWGTSPPAKEIKTTVTTPVGDQTVHYFSGWPVIDSSSDGFTKAEYGLPFSRKLTEGGKFISSQAYAGSPGTCAPQPCSPALKRSAYASYERDPLSEKQFDANRRPVGTRTIYNDDENRYIDTSSSDFDGVGHYRTVTTTASYPGNGLVRTSTTAFNLRDSAVDGNPSVLDTGTYPGSFAPPSPAAPWVLNTYRSVLSSEGTSSSKRQFCFEPSTGFLKGTRTFAGDLPGTTDLVVRFTEAGGNTAAEQFFGGDPHGAIGVPISSQASAFCSVLEAPGPIQYDLRHTYDRGVRATSRYYDAAGAPMPFLTVDNTVDVNTGLVTSSRDTAGIETTFSYDPLRRLTVVASPGSVPTTLTYFRATPTEGAYVTVEQLPSTGGAIRSEVHVDHLGRAILRKRLLPDGSYSSSDTTYDGMGWITSESEWESSPIHRTTYSNFDPFGRPWLISRADNKTTLFSYQGLRLMTRTMNVGSALSGSVVTETAATTTEETDGFGRLYQVTEGVNGNSYITRATYSYDVNNQLVGVLLTDGVTVQNRSFRHDGRGFLTDEVHPENEVAGRTNAYTYDARGHVVSRSVNSVGGAADIFDLKYAYDFAERLIRLESRDPATPTSFRVVKEFAYGSANVGATNLKLGKLERATRHNYTSQGDIDVTEEYTYGDSAGRLTGTTTTIRQGAVTLQTLDQSHEYNETGLRRKISYPTCLTVGCGTPTTGASPLVSIQPAYTNGFLTAIPEFVNSIGYAPNGMVNSVSHANGVIDTYEPDPNGIPRPASILFSGDSSCNPPVIDYQSQDPPGTLTYSSAQNPPSATLTVALVGGLASAVSGNPTFEWFRGSVGDTSAPVRVMGDKASLEDSFTTPPLTKTTSYWVRVGNPCGQVKSEQFVITIQLAPPGPVVAAADSPNSVFLQWALSPAGAAGYEVYRCSNGSCGSGMYALINTVPGPSYRDLTAVPDTTYVYRVRAVGEGVSPSDYSARDLATTMTSPFTALIKNETSVARAHFEEVLTAINRLRTALGWPTLTWAAILPAGVPAPDSGVYIYAAHITALRARMAEARDALVSPSEPSYTDPNLTTAVMIRTEHLTEVRERAQ